MMKLHRQQEKRSLQSQEEKSHPSHKKGNYKLIVWCLMMGVMAVGMYINIIFSKPDIIYKFTILGWPYRTFLFFIGIAITIFNGLE